MEKYSLSYWLNALRKAKESRKNLYKDAHESIALYSGNLEALKGLERSAIKDVKRRINCWSFVVNSIIPAYYSRLPDIECNLRSDRENEPVKLLASLIAEKAANYQIDEENDTHQVLYHFTSQYLLTGIGCYWLKYTPSIEGEEVTGERVQLESLCYDDYLCSDARKADEITWKARRAFLSKEEAIARFGEDKIKGINFDFVEQSDNSKDIQQAVDLEKGYQSKAAVWEIWCKESGKVYWLNYESDTKGELLDEDLPPISLADFYPCAELIANPAPNSVIPTSAYTLAKDSILETERLTERKHATLQAIRTNFLYDSILGDQVSSLFTDDLKGYAVTNKAINQVGKLSDMIEFTPIEPYVRALEIFTTAQQESLNRVFEQAGSSDLMRGMTNPQESATAQDLKHTYTSLRFSVPQRQIAETTEKAFNILTEILCEAFDPATIIETSNALALLPDVQEQIQQTQPAQMQQAPMPPQPVIQQNPIALVVQAVQLLKNDFVRRFSIAIKTDSMIALDERENRAERLELMQASSDALAKLMPIAQSNPNLVDAIKLQYQFVLRAYKGAKEIEPELMAVFDAVKQQAQAQQPPPPPDYEGKKIELENRKLSIKEKEIELQRLKLFQENELEQMQLSFKTQVESVKAEAAAIQAQVKAALDAQKLEIEKYKAAMTEREKLIEEKRLADDVITRRIESIERMQTTASTQAPAPSQPPVVLNIQSSDKKINFIRDEQGRPIGAVSEVINPQTVG